MVKKTESDRERSVFRKRIVFVLTLFCLSAGAAFAAAEEQELFTEAEGFYYAKNYPLSLDAFEKFIEQFPFSELIPDAEYRRALCLYHLKRWGESLAALENIQKRHRSTRYLSLIPFWKGMGRFSAKDYAAAAADFNDYLAQAGDPALSAQAWYYKAAAEAETGALDAAAASAQKLLAEFPKSEMADHGFLLLAFIQSKRGKHDELIALYRDPRAAALPAARKDKFLLYYAGALYAKNQKSEAKAIYENLVKAAPEISSVALAKLFTLAQTAGQVKELESLARRAEESLSGNPALLADFWTNVGIASYAAGQLEGAEYYFSRAWESRDKAAVSESVPLYLSEIYSKRGNDAKALAVLDEYLAGRDVQAEGVLFRLGSLAASAGDYAKAAAYLSSFVAKYPKSLRLAEAQYLLAYAYGQTGRTDEGLAVTAEALGRWPDDHKMKSALVRVRSRLLVKKGDADQAAQALVQRLSQKKDDFETRRDYIALLFSRKKYKEIVQAMKEAAPSLPALKRENPVLYLTLRYYEGLALIAQKEYERALASLSEFAPEYAEKRGVKEIIPSVLFYRGWAFYRMGKTLEAAPLFRSFTELYPKNELQPRALYLAGWCLYQAGRFAEAARFFKSLADRPGDRETALKGKFFLAKSLLGQGKAGEAAALFAEIFNAAASSQFAPDALFEYARIQADQGKAEAAAAGYVRLADDYPKHALAEEALYNRAQLYYRMNNLGAALDAFARYRERFPSGGQVDASLYWSGLCAVGRGDKAGALGHWEKLIQGYKESSFRSDALRKAAETYRQTGANDKALAAYQELAAFYPKEAKAMGAADQARELQYLVMGFSGREAELSARVEKEGGLATHNGRLAMADLAGLHLADKELKKIDLAYSIALQLVSRKDDKETQARGRFLLGEYWSIKKEYAKAGNEYLKAALGDPGSREQAARSIYQAALMMKLAGDVKSMRELVERLTKNFPESRWAAEGKRL